MGPYKWGLDVNRFLFRLVLDPLALWPTPLGSKRGGGGPPFLSLKGWASLPRVQENGYPLVVSAKKKCHKNGKINGATNHVEVSKALCLGFMSDKWYYGRGFTVR